MSGYKQGNNGWPPVPYDQLPMQPGVYASDLEHQSLNAVSYYPDYNQPMFTPIDTSEDSAYYNGNFGQAQHYHSHNSEFVPSNSPMTAASGFAPGFPMQEMQFESQVYDPVSHNMMQNMNTPSQNYGHYEQRNTHKTQFRERGRGNNNNNRGRGKGPRQPPVRNSEFQNFPAYRGNQRGHRGQPTLSFQNRNKSFENTYDVQRDSYQHRGKNFNQYNPSDRPSRGKERGRYGRDKGGESTFNAHDDDNFDGRSTHNQNSSQARNSHNHNSSQSRSSQGSNRIREIGRDGGRMQSDNRPQDVKERRDKQGLSSHVKAVPEGGSHSMPKAEKENGPAGPKNYNSKGARPKYANRWNNQSADKDESQRGSLTEQLSKNAYECMVCCEIIKVESAIWSCDNCYHVFHLHCTKKWAHSSVDKESNAWRCPGCQNESASIPSQYRCFCGRRKDPRYVRGETPHSCGETCRKKRKGNCKHPCTILCHPGPCPPCSSMVSQPCDCGKDNKSVRCSVATPYKCDAACDKLLSCGEHKCLEKCHSGSCQMCTVSKTQVCYCGKKERQVLCGTTQYTMTSYSCEESCGRTLSCGNHVCEEACHPGECAPCSADPAVLTTCCCGKTPLAELDGVQRHSCLDPVPVCGQTCNKSMRCGPSVDHHLCEGQCHEGECGPCDKETSVTCQCGRIQKDFSCETAVGYNDKNPFKCQKRCGKKKTCGRHKCADNCCVKDFHICEYICGMKLTCGIHKCKELCHRGNCKRCYETSFDELPCYCGATIMEPPIPCGTKPPECPMQCPRKRDCGHPVRHNCHMDDDCPPCTELTEKACMGGHTIRKNIPCHMKNISCGMACQKELPCGMHRCQKVCHKPPCLEEGSCCTQACIKPRSTCGHPCAAPCHSGNCPATFCKTEIMITCSCGNRSTKMECQMGGDLSTEIAQFQRLSVQSIAESGWDGVDLAQFSQTKPGSRKLDCDTSCAVLERNKRMALALEIKNPDVSDKLGNPTYTDFLKDFGKKNSAFVASIEKAIITLVQAAQKSPQSHRSHSFPSMNRDQRRFVHELAEFYGCQTQSYDYEPNKNVVATAYRDKCWMPNGSLTQILTKDQSVRAPPLSGMRTQGVTFTVLEKKKVNAPVDEQPAPKRAWESTSLSKPASQAKSTGTSKPAAAPAIDYFDFTEP